MSKKKKDNPQGWLTSAKERRNYVIGDMARYLEGYTITAFMSTYLMLRGIDLTAVAGLMLIVKIIDAFDDVIFGYFIDKIDICNWKAFKKITGEGKYLPWYRLVFIFFPIFTCLFFFMPNSLTDAAKYIWFVVFYLLYDFTYTLVEVPMNSMTVSITDNMDERNHLIQTKTILNAFMVIGVGALWTVLISESVGIGIPTVVLTSSIIFLVLMLPLAFGVKEHNVELRNVSEEDKRYSLKDMFRCVITNKYLLIIILSTIVYQCLMTGSSVGLWMSYYIYGNSLVLIIPIAISIIPSLVGQLMTKKLVSKFGKIKVYITTGLIGALIYGCICFCRYNFLACVIFLVLQAAPGNMSNIVKSFMIPDTIEYARYKTGKDCTGICYAVNSFATKLTSSVSSTIGLFILAQAGWREITGDSFEAVAALGANYQPASAINALWVVYAIIPAIGTLLGVLVMFAYNLKDKDAELMAKCNAGEITREECEAQLSRKY